MQAFIKELAVLDSQPAWVVGQVVPGKNDARILETRQVVEVSHA